MSILQPLAVGYYPGCSGLGTSLDYDQSTREVCRALGVSLQEIPDWTCCGSTPLHTVDTALSTAVAARNFAQAETVGIEDLVTPCPSCLKNLHNALHHLEDPVMRTRVEILNERPLKRPHSIKSVLQLLLEDVGLDAIAAKVTRPLTGLKAVCYYGCLMNRPAASMKFDDPENPVSMDKIIEALGAEVLPFPLKVECCGASFAIPFNGVVTKLSGSLLDVAAEMGADVVVVACPLCQMNLDLRQAQINRANKTRHKIPVPYFTQLMGWAFGVNEKDLGLGKLTNKIRAVFARMQERAKGMASEPAKTSKVNAAPGAGGTIASRVDPEAARAAEARVAAAKAKVTENDAGGGEPPKNDGNAEGQKNGGRS